MYDEWSSDETLPAAPNTDLPSPSPNSGRDEPSRPRVVVVDDDSDIRITLTEVLEFEGYTVLQAANGAEALHVLRGLGDLPYLLLLDMMMPVMNGEQVLRALRSDNQLPRVPVVVLSATKPASDAIAGARICLHKPISYDRLIGILARLYPR